MLFNTMLAVCSVSVWSKPVDTKYSYSQYQACDKRMGQNHL